MPSDRVFLTGATGFIGSHVLTYLRAAGYEVRALARDPATHFDGAQTVAGDLRSPGMFARSLDGCRYVVHCAADYSFAPRAARELHAVNVTGTSGLLEAARIAGVERAVVTSSSATVGAAPPGRSATEADYAAGAGGGYHTSKVHQERAALRARVPVVLLLPTAPVGPGDRKPTPTGKIVVDFARGRMFARPPRGSLNVVAVEDVAAAHVRALTAGRSGERYLVGGENMSLDALWTVLGEVTGRAVPSWRAPLALAYAAAYADELRCRLDPRATPFVPLEGVHMSTQRMEVDCTKAARELGHTVSPVRDALARALEWYKVNGYVA